MLHEIAVILVSLLMLSASQLLQQQTIQAIPHAIYCWLKKGCEFPMRLLPQRNL